MEKNRKECEKWPLKEGAKTSYGYIIKIYETEKQNIKFVLIKNNAEPFTNTYSIYKYDKSVNGGTYSTFHFIPDYIARDISNHVEIEKSTNKKEVRDKDSSSEEENYENDNSDKEKINKSNKNYSEKKSSSKKRHSNSHNDSMFEIDKSSENDDKQLIENKKSSKKAKIKVNRKKS